MNQKEKVSELSQATMDSLTAEEKFPDVKENAIEAVTAKKEAEISNTDIPQENTVNIETKKKRGRPRKDANAPQEKPKFVDPRRKQEPKPEDVKPNDSEFAAKVTSDIIETMTIKLISNDWKLQEIEKASNVIAWRETFDYYGGVNLSPPVSLALNHLSIISSRALTSSETKTKLSLAKNWFKLKLSKLKKGKKDALSNTRENNERENNVGEKESSQPSKTPE